MQILRRNVPVLLAFLAGTIMWAQYFIPNRKSQQVLEVFSSSWTVIIASTALILGILSALHYHFTKIQNRKPGFGYSVITLIVFVVMTIVGIFPLHIPGFKEVANNPDSMYQWMFDYLYTPLAATMFSTLAFFIASAAFRAFRARSFEATALLIAGCIVMLGRVSIGEQIPIWPSNPPLHLSDLSGWIFNNLNTAGQTGILIGIILSQIAISLRVIFGVERTYMGGGD
jgi:hypothetical protein